MLDARWPGRLEIIRIAQDNKPLIVLDGGHNADGVEKLTESIAALWGGKKVGIVYGVMKDKDYNQCLETLNTLKPAFYATCVPGMERSLSAKNLAEAAQSLNWHNAVADFENPLDAVAAASRENDIVVVCGSLYLIGWVRPRLVQ
jgi:dihydrofolate synthase/folylpolyglutamate synthase